MLSWIPGTPRIWQETPDSNPLRIVISLSIPLLLHYFSGSSSPRGLPTWGHQIRDGMRALSSRPVECQLVPSKSLGNKEQIWERDFTSCLFSLSWPSQSKKNKLMKRKGVCKTRIGLHLRAVGENPATADAAGINVDRYKYVSTCIHIYSGKEEHIHHYVSLNSSIRTSWTVRIWKRKQESVNTAIKKYFPLKIDSSMLSLQQITWQPFEHQARKGYYDIFCRYISFNQFYNLDWSKNHRHLVLLLQGELKGH